MKKAAFLMATIALLFGCATAPPVQKTETVVFYPPPPQPPRLQFLHTVTAEEDLGTTKSGFQQFLLGNPETGKILGKPYDIASSPGKIYILDRALRRVVIIDLAKRTFDYIRDQRLGALDDPSGIWVTPEDIKYVADMKRQQVVVFGRDNEFLRTYGGKEVLDRPTDVAVFGDRIYVCDMNRNRITVLDIHNGSVLGAIGEKGTEEGQMNKPTHVIVDARGNIFVNDAFNFRVQQFDPSGKFVRSYGYLGDGLGAFARPKGLDVDRKGNLYVVDAAFENVQIFDDQTARLLLFFGGPGTGPGNLYLPSGVHIDYANAAYFRNFADKDFRLDYVVYVGNNFGPNKINVYGFGEWIGEPLSADRSKEYVEVKRPVTSMAVPGKAEVFQPPLR